LNDLLVAAVVFLGSHVGIASTPLRAQLVGSIGERRYRILYSLLAVVTLVWLVIAYGRAPQVPLWAGSPWVALVLMPLALLLLVGGLAGPNPTAIGQAPDPDAPEPARGVLRITRHPIMWGTGLWGLGHLAAAGDLASALFFGTLALLALGGTFLLDAKHTARNAPGWGVFLQRTSNLPFLAIAERRQRIAPAEIGLRVLGPALALLAALLVLHPWLFGVSALP
jgi:uncharacterized membrane protein